MPLSDSGPFGPSHTEYARPGEVLVSQEVVDASSGAAVAFREIDQVELTGVTTAMRLHAAQRPG
jgi:class 3 adenylate cyclase